MHALSRNQPSRTSSRSDGRSMNPSYCDNVYLARCENPGLSFKAKLNLLRCRTHRLVSKRALRAADVRSQNWEKTRSIFSIMPSCNLKFFNHCPGCWHRRCGKTSWQQTIAAKDGYDHDREKRKRIGGTRGGRKDCLEAAKWKWTLQSSMFLKRRMTSS